MSGIEKNIAIVCNKLAGGGRAVTMSKQVSLQLGSKQISHKIFLNDWPQDFGKFDHVWIIGGDGTLNYFINKYPNISLPLAVFGGGTGNDVFSVLYNTSSIEEQVDLILNSNPRPVDGGRCNDKLFINGVGIGFEGAVAKSLTGKKKTKPGKAAFMGTILQKVFFYRSKKYKIITDKDQSEKLYLLVSIMNGHRAGGGFHIAPESAIDDGLLDIVMVDKLHPFQRLKWLPVIEKGKHLKLPFITHFRSGKIIISSDVPMDAHLDGEYLSAKRYEIEILPSQFLFSF